MSGVNVQVSVSNLPQIDRHQNDIHKNPTVNQDQNAKIAVNEMSQKLTKAVQPDGTEGKNVDPNQTKKVDDKKKQQRKDTKEKIAPIKKKRRDEGYIVDIEA